MKRNLSGTKGYIASVLFLLSISSNGQHPSGQAYPDGTTQTLNTTPTYSGTPLLNSIKTWEPQRPITTVVEAVSPDRTTDELRRTAQYSDGLGRPVQNVSWQSSPKNSSGQAFDVVSLITYDAFGRETDKYLPYVAGSANGNFKSDAFTEQNNFLKNVYNPANDSNGEKFFYSKTNYEPSPLNRISKTLAPGNSWAGNDRGISIGYEINTGAQEVRLWNIASTLGATPTSGGFYGVKELYRTVTKDEHDKRVIEYKDKEGHVVLKKVELSQPSNSAPDIEYHTDWLCTYYVYDDLGNLRFVIPPKAVEAVQNSWSLTTDIVNGLCFSYSYDDKDRMIVKKVPGADEVHMVYDNRDRLVMTQDGNLRPNGQWLVSQYDELNRPKATSLWQNGQDRNTSQNNVNNNANWILSYGAIDPLTETYYDDYNWTAGAGLPSFNAGESSSGFLAASDVAFPYARSVVPDYSVIGMVTGSKVKVLGTGTYLYTVNYYDDRARMIQTQIKNITGAIDIITNQYSFDGKVLVSKNNHSANGMAPGNVVVWTRMDYDHAGRLLKIRKQVNSDAEVTIAENAYDQMGQLITKKLGQKNGNPPIETLDYSYNVRGWLKSINRDYAANVHNNNYFGEQLSYDFGFTENQYNGNIAGITWKSGNDNQARAYGYRYDAANRLLKAEFTESYAGSWNTWQGRDFTTTMGNNGSDPLSAYDANGNIKKMVHNITPGNPIDNLDYNYDDAAIGNRLLRVTDNANNPASTLGDFKEITSGQWQDYWYDANGNMTRDDNKGISSITYNYLNLPATITVANTGTVSYVYDAAGTKHKKIVYDNATGATTTSVYINGMEYSTSNELRQIPHEEGRIRRKPDGSYVYDYFLRDHLGSVRVTLTEEQTAQVYSMATMEPGNADVENTYYYNIDDTREKKPSAYPGRTEKDMYASKLDGDNKKKGPAILLKVNAGDTIHISADSWYQKNGKEAPKNKIPLSQLAEIFAGKGAAVAKGATGLSAAASNALVPAILEFLTKNGRAVDRNEKPKAYLNWILLDENLKVIKDDSTINPLKRNEYSGFIPAGEEKQLKKMIKQGWKIAKSGYVYIFTSNESAETDVYYDNLMVTDVQGPLLEVNHTYPFGLTIQNISSQAPGRLENKFRFNGGNELQNKEFNDGSGLETYDANHRMYDPQIGKFLQIDPLEGVARQLSPFAFGNNNPILLNDPSGLSSTTPGVDAQDDKDNAMLGNVTVTSTPKPKSNWLGWPSSTSSQRKQWKANQNLYYSRTLNGQPAIQKGDAATYTSSVGMYKRWDKADREFRQNSIGALLIIGSPVLITTLSGTGIGSILLNPGLANPLAITGRLGAMAQVKAAMGIGNAAADAYYQVITLAAKDQLSLSNFNYGSTAGNLFFSNPLFSSLPGAANASITGDAFLSSWGKGIFGDAIGNIPIPGGGFGLRLGMEGFTLPLIGNLTSDVATGGFIEPQP